MSQHQRRHHVRPMLRTAVVFEGVLVVLAFVLAWQFRIRFPGDPSQGNVTGAQIGWAIGVGIVAAVPMVVVFILMTRFPIGPLRRLKLIVDRLIAGIFARASVGELALVSLLAGVGEELLFRGVVHSLVLRWRSDDVGVVAAVLFSAVTFGVCHWLTNLYFVIAAVIGVYFSVLMLATGQILTPIVAHAFYDFVVLLILVKRGAESP